MANLISVAFLYYLVVINTQFKLVSLFSLLFAVLCIANTDICCNRGTPGEVNDFIRKLKPQFL
jgi:hypothetical protein